MKIIKRYPNLIKFIEVAPEGCMVRLRDDSATIVTNAYSVSAKISVDHVTILFGDEEKVYSNFDKALEVFVKGLKMAYPIKKFAQKEVVLEIVRSLESSGWEIKDKIYKVEIRKFSD